MQLGYLVIFINVPENFSHFRGDIFMLVYCVMLIPREWDSYTEESLYLFNIWAPCIVFHFDCTLLTQLGHYLSRDYVILDDDFLTFRHL